MLSLNLEITAFDENSGDEADVREAMQRLSESGEYPNLNLSGLLYRLGTNGGYDDFASVTLKGDDEVWNEGTDAEARVEPPHYTFYLRALD